MTTIYGSGFNVSPSDTQNLPFVITGLYVGGAGVVVVMLLDNSIVTLAGAIAGTVLPIQAKRVMSTGTTATLLVGLS